MKTSTKLLLSCVFLVTLSTKTFSNTIVQTNKLDKVSISYNLTANDVYNYLTLNEYDVLNLWPLPDGYWLAKTVKNGIVWRTTVFVDSTGIVGNEDTPW